MPADAVERGRSGGGSTGLGLDLARRTAQASGGGVRVGIPAYDALGAASWRARDWLGFDCLEEGSSADFVVYDRDPLADLSVLRSPSCVVLRGVIRRQ
jgi:imidazolonepropionase-like amidohydrolase